MAEGYVLPRILDSFENTGVLGKFDFLFTRMDWVIVFMAVIILLLIYAIYSLHEIHEHQKLLAVKEKAQSNFEYALFLSPGFEPLTQPYINARDKIEAKNETTV